MRTRELYERFRVPEYWILNPDAKRITVFRIGEDGKYGPETELLEQDSIALLCAPEATLKVADLFPELPPEDDQ